MTAKTLIDISNSIFAITHPAPSDISGIFNPTDGVNLENDSFTNMNTLLKKLYDHSRYSHIALYTAYKLHAETSVSEEKKEKIIDYVYGENMYNISNLNTTNTKHIYSLFNILTFDSNRVSEILSKSGSEILSTEKEVFQSAKKVYLERFTLDICNNELLTHFHNLSSSDTNSHWTNYLHNINKNLNLDGINLSNKNLSGHNFRGYKLTNANLSGANLSNTDLSGVNLTNSNVSNLNLNNSSITNIVAAKISGTPNNVPSGFTFDSNRKVIVKNKETKTVSQWKSKNNEVGITNTVIDDIDTDTDIFNSGFMKSTTQTKIRNALSGTSLERKKKRHALFNYLFENNSSVSKLKLLKSNAGLPDKFKKVKVSVYKPGETIDFVNDTDLDSDTGFYSALEDGDFVHFKPPSGRIIFSITRIGSIGDSGKYTVSKYGSNTYPYNNDLNVSNVNSETYDTEGYFVDGDTAEINNLSIFFGGVGEGESANSTADPYVFPCYGRPTKLPDCSAMYKMCEGYNLHINSVVDHLSKDKKKYLHNWAKKTYGINSEKHGLISNGYYYKKHFLISEGHELLCDLNKNKMLYSKESENYFTIKNSMMIDSTKELLGEKYLAHIIHWKHSKYGNIFLTIRNYINPQIDNGISLNIEKNTKDCGGLLIRNYNPKQLTINNIRHNSRVSKYLESGNIFVKPLKPKNEIWTHN